LSSEEIQKLKFEHEEEEEEEEEETEEEEEEEEDDDDTENSCQKAFDCSSNINNSNSNIVLPKRSPIKEIPEIPDNLNYSFEENECNHKNASLTDSYKLQEDYERVPNFTNEETVEGILSNLEKRYKTYKEIYSIYGNILVSINPFCETKLYSNEYLKIYNSCIKDRTSETKEPHLFKTCAKVLNNLIE